MHWFHMYENKNAKSHHHLLYIILNIHDIRYMSNSPSVQSPDEIKACRGIDQWKEFQAQVLYEFVHPKQQRLLSHLHLMDGLRR